MTIPVTQRRGDWMQTFTGRAFFPLDPLPEDVSPLDIAHALSNICRFGGHTRVHYSVAEHCVILSQVVRPENALAALLHDAAEAYMGDMVRPLKKHMPQYAEAEDNLLATIFTYFGLEPGIPAEVHSVDNRILLDERAALLTTPPLPWYQDEQQEEPLDVTIKAWPADKAEREWHRRLGQLWNGAY